MKQVIFIFLFISIAFSQNNFPKQYLGTWEGEMVIVIGSEIKNKIGIKLTIDETENDNVWIWKTEYISDKYPAVKDYKLKLIDASKNLYIVDEGGGLELEAYYFDSKLYSVFSYQDILLTGIYEFKDNEIIFEVTSGKKGKELPHKVANYPITGFQKYRVKRAKGN